MNDAIRWPAIFNRYVEEVAKESPEAHPRQTVRRYHGLDVNLWYGKVHVDDVEGWVENTRLKHYLGRWKAKQQDRSLAPTTNDIYDIMVEGDLEEKMEGKKPFHLDRLAENISRNDIQEPIVLHVKANGGNVLWDGNRRFFATKHIMRDENFRNARDRKQWLPAFVFVTSGDPAHDDKVKHNILTELNFVEKDHIPWPAYVKAAEVFQSYHSTIDMDNSLLAKRQAKERVAKEYGLGTARKADRWIRMYELAQSFKSYCENERDRDEVEVDLKIQDKFEYFDELTKSGVWGVLKDDLDNQHEVFEWLWDGKFIAFPDVRWVPKILADPVARKIANTNDDGDAVKRAISTLIANDPLLSKNKEAANEKIKQFASWLDTFKREDFRKLDPSTLEYLETILKDVTQMLSGLLRPVSPPENTSNE